MSHNNSNNIRVPFIIAFKISKMVFKTILSLISNHSTGLYDVEKVNKHEETSKNKNQKI